MFHLISVCVLCFFPRLCIKCYLNGCDRLSIRVKNATHYPTSIVTGLCKELLSYLNVARLFHKSSSIFCSSVSFGQLDSKELESPLKVGLQEVLFGRLQGEEEETGGETEMSERRGFSRYKGSFINTYSENMYIYIIIFNIQKMLKIALFFN